MDQQQQDDKKRREPSSSLDQSSDVVTRPNKRALSSSEASVQSNSSAPTEQKDQNVLLFQNRAMKIRVEEQKQEISDMEKKLKGINHKLHHSEETISCLCRVWDQLNQGLNMLLGRVDFETSMDDLLPKGVVTESHNFLTSYIAEPPPIDDHYSIDLVLQQRVQKTQLVFSKIADALEKEHSLSSVIFRLLKSSKDSIKSNDFERILKEENDKLSRQMQMMQTVYDRMQLQLKQMTDQSSLLADQSSSYQTTIKELREELERNVDDLNLERKRVIKLQDDSLKVAPVKLSPTLTGSTTNTMALNGTQKPNASGSGPEANGKDSQSHEEMIAELTRQSEGRLLEARKLREEKANLLKELQQLQFDIRIIPEERIINSMPYQILRQRLQLVSDELDIHRNQCIKLQSDLTQTTISKRLEREQLEAFELSKRQGLERRVTQMESETMELKSEKEKLINLIEQKNQNIPSQEYISESKLLLDTKDQDIQKLKKEVDSLKLEIEKYKNYKEEIQKMESKSARDIEFKNIEIKELCDKLREITRLNEELKQTEKKLTEREKELVLSVELLKSSSSETADVIELRISEKKLQEELASTKLLVTELSSIKQLHQQEIETLTEKFKQKIHELEATVNQDKLNQESQKQEIEALIMEIDNMGKAYEQMQEQNTRLVKQLSDKEDMHAHLMAENIKSQQTIRLSKEQQQAVDEKMSKNEEKMKAQAELMQKIEERSSLLQKQLSKVSEDLHICNFELEKHKRFVRENSAHSVELKTQLDHLNNLNVELKKKSDDSIFALEREIDKAKRLDEEKQLLKKKLEKVNLKSSSSSSTAEDELKLVNQKLRCTICNDRQKNTVIAKCFHVFCKECIYSNIESRKRRCPGCKRPFSESDVHQIYLT
eukprot:gene3158-3952_t